MRGVEVTWAGGEHNFHLPIELLRALQDKCDAGPAWILNRLSTKQWRVDDVIQPIRLGLEGGGMDKQDAYALAKRHVEDQPLHGSVDTAMVVLMAALFGAEEDPVGESEAGADKTTENSSLAENTVGQTT